MARGKKIEINVDQECINHAIQHTSTRCAIAMAIKTASPYYSHPVVTADKVVFTDTRTETRYTWKLGDDEGSEQIRRFIGSWDTKKNTVRPTVLQFNTADAVAKPVRHAQPSELIAMAERVRGLRTVRKSEGAVRRSERP